MSDPVKPLLLEEARRIVDKTSGRATEPAGSGVAKKKGGLNPLFLAGPVAAQGFDAFSTDHALNAGGRHEANDALSGIAGNDAKLYGTKLASGLLIAFAADRLARSGHRTAGKILSVLGTAVPTAAGIHNMTLKEPGK